MKITPSSLKEIKAFVALYHRHNKPPQGYKFGVNLVDDDNCLIGVGSAGRPVARALDDGTTIEITRVATDTTKNANSMIYGALCRAARALGYTKAITYTLHEESGISLKAAGFTLITTKAGGNNWNALKRQNRFFNEKLACKKNRWEKKL